MKKIICTISVIALLLTGCGKKPKGIVLDDLDDGVVTRVTTQIETTTRKKRQERTTASKDSVVTTSASSSLSTISTNETELSAITSAPDDETSEIQTDNPENTETTTVEEYQKPTELYYLDGIVYEVHEKSILINESDFKRINVSVSDPSKIAGIQVGDVVDITYDGLLNEGYISYAYDAYSVEVVKKAEEKYEFKKFECNDMSFSMLVPESWNCKIIDYPQGSDFTDWGMRFIPDGLDIGLDVSWHSAIFIPGGLGLRSTTVSGLPVTEYTQSYVWRFIKFENNYIISNNLFDSPIFLDYKDQFDFIINTIEFE